MNAQLCNDPMIVGVDPMPTAIATQLHPAPLHLAPVGTKAVALDFDGGRLSSEAGVVLLKDIDDQLGLTHALAAVLSDQRDARRIHFTLEDLLKQRVWQIAAGYEDANDSNTLRDDPIFKLLLDRLPERLFEKFRPPRADATSGASWRGKSSPHCSWATVHSPCSNGATG
jgi:hypothetical protein